MSVTDEIKARLDIVDIVSDTVTLKKSGRNYTGFCPFHSNTKTPSFVVFPETQTWRCFGACADGGDLFSFVIKREGYEFKEALEDLAKRAGIELQPINPQTVEQDERRKKLLEINAAAAVYFHKLLTNSTAGAGVREYLAGRGLIAETIAIFQLGYALKEWEALKKDFIARGYSAEELTEAGLLVKRDDGSPGYDRFRHRLMIPIRDPQGRVTGFGARALDANEKAKYINSPQTTLFNKSNTLYGLDIARNHIRQADRAVIVEGYMDVIQAYQHKARNLVAQMGTALTEQQLKILKRTTNNFVLALDSDTAGNAATLRGINVARETLHRETMPVLTAHGLIQYENRLETDIRIATLPKGKDPDDILKEGLAVWQNIIDNATPVVEFYFQTITGKLDLTTAKGKSTAVRELIPILSDISSEVERNHYIQKLSRLIHIDERTLIAELHNTQQQPKTKPFIPEQPTLPPTEQVVRNNLKLEEYCLSLILTNPSILAVVNAELEEFELSELTINDFKQGDNRAIFKSLQLWTASEEPSLDILFEMVTDPLKELLKKLDSQWHSQPPTPLEYINNELKKTILRLRLYNIYEQINELTFLLQETATNKDVTGTHYYRKIAHQCVQQRKKLEHTKNNLSLTGQRRAESKHYEKQV